METRNSHNNTMLRLWPWVMWAVGTVFVLFQFLLQLSSGVMVERLMDAFSTTAVGAGLLSGAYYYIYVALQTPAGMLIDRFGARRLMSVGALVTAVGCYVFSVTHQLWLADVARVLMGGGCAFSFVGTLYLISHWFPAHRFAFMLGLSDMFATIGSIVFNVSLASMIGQVSWRSIMTSASIFALIISVLLWFVVRDRPDDHLGDIASKKNLLSFRKQFSLVITDKRLWLNGVYIGILFSIVTVFTGMWGVPFIVLQEHVSNTMAAFLASSIFIGLGIACPFMGYLYPRVRKYMKQILSGAAGICAALLAYLIYFPPHSLIAYSVMMIIIGICSTVYVFNFALVKEFVSENISSTAIGFTNTLCVITVPIFQPIIGWLMHFSHRGATNGYEQYTLYDYHLALSVLPITLAIAAVLGYFVSHQDDARVAV